MSTPILDPTFSPVCVRPARRHWGPITSTLSLPLAIGVLLPFALACESDSLKPPPIPEPAELYWTLDFNHRAVRLSIKAPYDTLTVAAVPRNYLGAPLTGLPAPQYTSGDATKVAVTGDGVLQALEASSQTIPVVARLTVGNLTHVDTVLVQAVDVDPPPVLGSFSIHPVPPDTAKVGACSPSAGICDFLLKPLSLIARAADTGGVAIAGLSVFFRSSDSTIARIDRTTGQVSGLRPGPVTFYASTTAFGITKADTLPFRIGLRVVNRVDVRRVVPASGGAPVNAFFPSELRVGPGAMVIWATTDTSMVDITFDDDDLPNVHAAATFPTQLYRSPFNLNLLCFGFNTNCMSAGNIVITPPTNRGAVRVFSLPGTYEYRSTRYGTSGRIVVVDESGNAG
jgi:plastocyanin